MQSAFLDGLTKCVLAKIQCNLILRVVFKRNFIWRDLLYDFLRIYLCNGWKVILLEFCGNAHVFLWIFRVDLMLIEFKSWLRKPTLLPLIFRLKILKQKSKPLKGFQEMCNWISQVLKAYAFSCLIDINLHNNWNLPFFSRQ